MTPSTMVALCSGFLLVAVAVAAAANVLVWFAERAGLIDTRRALGEVDPDDFGAYLNREKDRE